MMEVLAMTTVEYGLLPVDYQHDATNPMRNLFGITRQMAREEAQRAQIVAYLNTVKGECEVALGQIDRRIEELEVTARDLAESLLPEGSKHVDLPGLARFQFTDRAPSFTVADSDALLQWAVEHERDDLVEHKPTLRRSAAIEAAKQGEVLPGIDPVAGRRTMSIQLEGR